MPEDALLSQKSTPALGVVSQKLPPAIGGARFWARGPRALKLGRPRPPPARPSWSTWKGRGSPASQKLPRREQRRGATRVQAPSPPQAPQKSAPGRRRQGPHTTRRTRQVRPGAVLLPSTAPSVVSLSVCPQPPPRPHRRGKCGRRAPQTQQVLADLSLRTHPPRKRCPAAPPPLVSATSVPTWVRLAAPRLRSSDPVSAPQCHHARARARAGRTRGMLGAEVLRVRGAGATRSARPRTPLGASFPSPVTFEARF